MILQGQQTSWHKLTSSSGCSSCWSLHAAQWDVGSLYLQCTPLPAGHLAELSKARRYTQLGTSSEEEGTFFKSRLKENVIQVVHKYVFPKKLKIGQIMVLLDIVSIFVCLLSKCNRWVNPEELVKESTCWKPLPVSSIQGPVAVQ